MEDKKILLTIANNIKKIRKLNNMTQEELSNMSNVSIRHLQKIESGTLNTTILTLNKISCALNIHISDLFK